MGFGQALSGLASSASNLDIIGNNIANSGTVGFKSSTGTFADIYANAAVDGKTVLDFNKAYNPPCTFNAYSTCPLPPPETRLDLAVTAGEKKYAGPTH